MALRFVCTRILASQFRKIPRPTLQSTYIYGKIHKSIPFTHYIASFCSKSAIIPRRASFDSDLKTSSDLIASGDPDTFGALVDNEDELMDAGDKKENEYTKNKPRRWQQLSTKQYADMIKEHLQYHRVKEAIDVLEVRMLKQDRVKPENYLYNLLISGCGRAGYTRKAFQLYNKMKQRDLKVTGGTYTSLFNACANCPTKEDGLAKANKLRKIMLEKGYEPNVSNYNAMIKAYGRCGDTQTAFLLADEMSEKRLPVGVQTYNFLLQACATDTELGFRHALLIWHKMVRRKIVPDIYSFNLMLRVVRDCSVGNLAALEDVITKILTPKNPLPLLSDPNKIPHITEAENSSELVIVPSDDEVDSTPNLLSQKPHLGSLVSISDITRPEDRLLLLGGQIGFLEEMKKAQVTPGIKTFTALLDVVPSTVAAEKLIISMIRKIGLKADIDFFNVLIKKRSMRLDYDGAKEVLSMIRTAKLKPDIVTYGVLALGCQTQLDAKQLLEQMYEKGVRMNIQILGAMLRQATFQCNFAYVFEIMQISLDEKIQPNTDFLRHLQKFQKYCFKLIEKRHPNTKTKEFQNNFTKFRMNYDQWRRENGIEGLKIEDAIKKLQESPYQQFKDSSSDGFEPTKNEKQQRRQKITKYIRKVKVNETAGAVKTEKYNTSVANSHQVKLEDPL